MYPVIAATSNSGKLREIQAVLAHLPIKLFAQSDYSVPPVAETGSSFLENAIIKARHAALHTQLPVLADDSGLEVDALGGAPGIYSARYAGESADDAANNKKLLYELSGRPYELRSARFHCVIVFLKHARDANPLICQGTWEGQILSKPQGKNGFGYDPLFYVPSHHCSAAQLPPEIKNKISHRGQALAQLMQALEKNL